MDRGRKILVSGPVAGNGTADAGKDMQEIQVVCPPHQPVLRHGQLQDDGFSTGLQHPEKLGKPALLVLEIPDAESTRDAVERPLPIGKILTVSNLEGNALPYTGFLRLAFHQRHHPLGNIGTDDFRSCSSGFSDGNGGIPRPARDIQDPLRGPVHDLPQGMAAPQLVYIQRQDVVEFVVGRRDVVEHLAHFLLPGHYGTGS